MIIRAQGLIGTKALEATTTAGQPTAGREITSTLSMLTVIISTLQQAAIHTAAQAAIRTSK